MEFEKNFKENTKEINITKGYIKRILSFLSLQLNMTQHNSHDQNDIKILTELLQELYDIAHRDNIYDPIYLFSKRQKASTANFLLEHLYNK